LWFITLSRTTTTGAESQAEAIIKCSNANFQILSVDTTNNKATVVHYGSGLKVYPMIATVGATPVTLTGYNAPDPPTITAGQTSTFNLTIGTNTTVKVIALCEYGVINTSIEATCSTPEACWH